jgi:hypothetical protein
LQSPCHFRTKIEFFKAYRRVQIHDIVPEIDLRVSNHLLIGSSHPRVKLRNVAVLQEVLKSVIAHFKFCIDCPVVAGELVNDDLVLSKSLLKTTFNSAFNVDVPDSAAIHQVYSLEVLRGKNAWD